MLTLFTGNSVRDRDTLIGQIAKEVAGATHAQLRQAAAAMQVAELRGYVRARASSVARQRVRQLIADRNLPTDCEAELTAAILERTVHFVIRDLFVQPVTAIPSPHVRSRAAA